MALLSVAEAHARLMALVRARSAPRRCRSPRPPAGCSPPTSSPVATSRPSTPRRWTATPAAPPTPGPGAVLTVVGTAAAGRAPSPAASVPARRCASSPARRCPTGADWIVIQEEAEAVGDRVTVTAAQGGPPNIRPAGGDFRRGERARRPAPAARRPTSALLAAMNAARRHRGAPAGGGADPDRRRARRPRRGPGPDQIVSSNDIALKALLEAAGAAGRRLPIARDTPESLAGDPRPRRRRRPDRHHRRRLGRRLRPGARHRRAPTASSSTSTASPCARASRCWPAASAACRWSACPATRRRRFVTAHLFLRPAIERMLGLPGDPPARATRRDSPRRSGRTARAPTTCAPVCESTDAGGGWTCTPLALQDSSLVGVLAEANALLVAPAARSRPRRRRNRRVHLAVTNRRLYRAKILDTNQERN